MFVLSLVVACLFALTALTVAAVILSSRLNRDPVDVPWLESQDAGASDPFAPEPEPPTT